MLVHIFGLLLEVLEGFSRLSMHLLLKLCTKLWIPKDSGVHIKLACSFSMMSVSHSSPRRCTRIQEPSHKQKTVQQFYKRLWKKFNSRSERWRDLGREAAGASNSDLIHLISFFANSSDQQLPVWPELSYEIVFVLCLLLYVQGQ